MKGLRLCLSICVVAFFCFLPASGLCLEAYIPHITGGASNWTDYLEVDNGSVASQSFTLTLYGQGNQLYSGSFTVDGLSESVISLKSLSSNAECGVVTYNSNLLNFRLAYDNLNGGGVAEFRLTNELFATLCFYFSDFKTAISGKGIALANLNSSSATVEIYALGNGGIIDSTTITISPYERVTGIHSTFFPGLSFSDVKKIVAVSASNLCGITISGNADNSLMLFTRASELADFDTGGLTTWYRDFDNDGFGDSSDTTLSATNPSGYVSKPGDLNDNDETIYPGAAEICGDGIDQDCDGVDEPCQTKNANGTYTYDSGTNILVVNVVSSSFSGCGPEVGIGQIEVTALSSANMTWVTEGGSIMNWTRKNGTDSGIVGQWEYIDGNDKLDADFYSDGSFSMSGKMLDCDQDVQISTFSVPRANVTIDGNISDWSGIDPVFNDAVNDEDPEADFDGTDLYQFYLSRDDNFLYLMLTLYDDDPNPNAQYALELVPNAGSGRGETGDYLAIAAHRDGYWQARVDVRDAPNLTSIYPSGYVGIGNHCLEWKVRLSDMHFFDDRYIFVYIHDFSPIFYPVSDRKETGIEVAID